jgi:thymidylate synthase (FAD)
MTQTTTNSSTNSVKLIWTTPDGDNLLGYMARVSNPKATPEDDASRLIAYLIKHRHWSPFEMVNACVRIECPRDISRQLLRHRSFSFQEFSGRYSAYDALSSTREIRLQDQQNRQNSLSCGDGGLSEWWQNSLDVLRDLSWKTYLAALDRGVAKEVARVLLPEGLVPTVMYMNGTLRSWIHYWSVRCTPETQKEHRLVAEATRDAILHEFPGIAKTLAMAQEHPDPTARGPGGKGE